MASMGTEEFRKLLADRLEKFIKRTPDRDQYPVPPPQIIEAMVDVETGGTFDPDFVDPNSGAIGLGNIMLDGLEWGVYKANHPDAKESDLTDPGGGDPRSYQMNKTAPGKLAEEVAAVFIGPRKTRHIFFARWGLDHFPPRPFAFTHSSVDRLPDFLVPISKSPKF